MLASFLIGLREGHLIAALGIAGFSAALLTGCVPTAPASGTTHVEVESSANDCILDATAVEAGTVIFTVTNTGDRVTAFSLMGADGVSIVAEVDDIAPGSSRDLTVTVEAGSYVTECNPGMAGDGVGTAGFTVN